MLYAGCTTSNYSTNTGTGTTSSPSGNICCCPNCGSWHEFAPVRYESFFDPDPEPLPLPLYKQQQPWLPLRHDRMPRQHFAVARSGFGRHGRTLRHRGGIFRNFHKLRE